MAGTDRDLVAALRAELAAIDPVRPCDRLAEVAGLGTHPVTREPTVARLIVRMGGRTPDGGQTSAASLHGPHPGSGARRAFVLPHVLLDWAGSAEHCRLAWLRGRFLARGSLSLAGGRAHLEFVVPAQEAAELAARLADVGLPASWRLRRGQGVVTWKSAESIASFLGRIGARSSLLELEARSVARSLRGELNRVINAESANLHRSVAASGRQLAAIDVLEADGRLAEQPRTVRAVAEARRETPEASLSDIAVRMDLHRSAVQRALDRLERLALHDDGGVGLRGRRGARAERSLDDRPSGAGSGESTGRRMRGRRGAVQGPSGRGEAHAPLA